MTCRSGDVEAYPCIRIFLLSSGLLAAIPVISLTFDVYSVVDNAFRVKVGVDYATTVIVITKERQWRSLVSVW